MNKLYPAAATRKNVYNKVLTCTGQSIFEERHFMYITICETQTSISDRQHL